MKTRSIIAALLLTCLPVATAHAQTPAPAPPAAATAATAAAEPQQLLKTEELDQLVAPIALYPDTVLAEVLMAATYPLEMVQADRWVTANKALKGDPLKTAVDKQSWDESVKSLVATPTVLAMMSEKLDWTQKLGDAVLAQQQDVMDAVQRLRTKAQANNKLASTKEQKVSVTQQENKQVIVIEPAVPDTVYVPYYDPAVVYGDWGYPDYPPYYFAPPIGYLPGAVLATGIAFGAGYALGRWASGGNYWGGGVNWGGGNINVNRPININNIGSGNNWQHNPSHRQGVKYSNASVQQKFGNNATRAGSQDRADFRGHDQANKPGGGDKAGDRAGASDRAGGNRPSADAKPGAKAGSKAGSKAASKTGSKSGAKGAGDRSAGKGSAGGGAPKRDSAMGNIQSGKVANAQAARGREGLGGGAAAAHLGGGRGGAASLGGGGGRMGGGGGGFSGGGGRGGGGGGGGGRRSDINAKHDITLIGRLDNGLGFYRYSYNGSDKAYVGVMAQEVQEVRPDAVVRGRDGYLRVFYDKLGLPFETYDHWVASGSRIPSATAIRNMQMQNW